MENRMASPTRLNARNLTSIFKALADPVRIRIVEILAQTPLCVCKIHGLLGMSQPRVSRHLRILKQAGLITCSQQGKWCHYRIQSGKEWKEAQKLILLSNTKHRNKKPADKGCIS